MLLAENPLYSYQKRPKDCTWPTKKNYEFPNFLRKHFEMSTFDFFIVKKIFGIGPNPIKKDPKDCT